MPRLPPIIYGVISILCGIVSLYIPETLNRPLPNSIDDVVKWPKKLSKEESKIVKELNKKEFDFVKQKIKFILSKFFKCNREGQATKNSDSPKSKIYNDIRSKNLKSSSILLINESEPLSKEKLIDSNPTITSNITATTNTTANTTTEANLNIKNNNNNIVENCESNKKQDEVNSNTFPSLSSSFSTNSLSSLNKLTNSNEESSTKLIKSSTIATSLSQPS